MNPDFEKRLQQHPMRGLPREWRSEILAAAKDVMPHASERLSFSALFKLRLRELLWPCPQAWAGLAAVWLLLLVFNFAEGEKPSQQFGQQKPLSREVKALLKEQEQLRAELLQMSEPEPADRPRSNSRSDCRSKLQLA